MIVDLYLHENLPTRRALMGMKNIDSRKYPMQLSEEGSSAKMEVADEDIERIADRCFVAIKITRYPLLWHLLTAVCQKWKKRFQF